MTYTTNYRLKKPGTNDHYNVGDFNENSDTIDRNLKSVSDSTSGLSSTVSTMSGTVSALSSTVSQHGTSIGAINTELTAQSGRITQVRNDLENWVSSVGGQFREVNSAISGLGSFISGELTQVGDRYIWERTSTSTGKISTVTSTNRSEYPDDGTRGSYNYKFAGQVGLRSTVGSYEGTGEYGLSNPNSLTFPFTPKLVIVTGVTLPDELAVFIQGQVGFIRSSANAVLATWSGTTLSWASAFSPDDQLNKSGAHYWYFAIG